MLAALRPGLLLSRLPLCLFQRELLPLPELPRRAALREAAGFFLPGSPRRAALRGLQPLPELPRRAALRGLPPLPGVPQRAALRGLPELPRRAALREAAASAGTSSAGCSTGAAASAGTSSAGCSAGAAASAGVSSACFFLVPGSGAAGSGLAAAGSPLGGRLFSGFFRCLSGIFRRRSLIHGQLGLLHRFCLFSRRLASAACGALGCRSGLLRSPFCGLRCGLLLYCGFFLLKPLLLIIQSMVLLYFQSRPTAGIIHDAPGIFPVNHRYYSILPSDLHGRIWTACEHSVNPAPKKACRPSLFGESGRLW